MIKSGFCECLTSAICAGTVHLELRVRLFRDSRIVTDLSSFSKRVSRLLKTSRSRRVGVDSVPQTFPTELPRYPGESCGKVWVPLNNTEDDKDSDGRILNEIRRVCARLLNPSAKSFRTWSSILRTSLGLTRYGGNWLFSEERVSYGNSKAQSIYWY